MVFLTFKFNYISYILSVKSYSLQMVETHKDPRDASEKPWLLFIYPKQCEPEFSIPINRP